MVRAPATRCINSAGRGCNAWGLQPPAPWGAAGVRGLAERVLGDPDGQALQGGLEIMCQCFRTY